MFRTIKTLTGGEEEISTLLWNKDGLFAGDMKGSIYYWPFESSLEGGLCQLGNLKSFISDSFPIISLSISDNFIYAISLDGKLLVLDFSKEDNKFLEFSEIKNGHCCLCLSNNIIIIGCLNGDIILFSSETRESKTFHFSTTPINQIKQIASNQIACLDSCGIAIYSYNFSSIFESFKKINQIKLSSEKCSDFSITDDGFSIVVSTRDGLMLIADTISHSEVGLQSFGNTELNSISSIVNGNRFVAASSDGMMYAFNLETMSREKGLKATSKFLTSITSSPTKMKIAAAGGDNRIVLIDVD